MKALPCRWCYKPNKSQLIDIHWRDTKAIFWCVCPIQLKPKCIIVRVRVWTLLINLYKTKSIHWRDRLFFCISLWVLYKQLKPEQLCLPCHNLSWAYFSALCLMVENLNQVNRVRQLEPGSHISGCECWLSMKLEQYTHYTMARLGYFFQIFISWFVYRKPDQTRLNPVEPGCRQFVAKLSPVSPPQYLGMWMLALNKTWTTWLRHLCSLFCIFLRFLSQTLHYENHETYENPIHSMSPFCRQCYHGLGYGVVFGPFISACVWSI